MKIIASGKCGENVSYELTEDGVLNIFGIGEMWDFYYNNSPFSRNKDIKQVFIDNGVTWIGYDSFKNCTSLKSINIPNSITEIGWSVFEGCTSLISIQIPNSVTRIERFAFKNCTLLKSIDIPSSVIEIHKSAFHGCISLKSIDVDVLNDNYSSDDGVLYNKDKNLLIKYPIGKPETSFIIPNYVKNITLDAFRDCALLKTIRIPNSVISIGDYAFYGCVSLSSIEIPNSIRKIGIAAFAGCISLDSIKINSVADIEYSAFKGCISLKSIEIPSSCIGGCAFDGCTSLILIKISNSNPQIEYSAFESCTSLKTIVCLSELPPLVIYTEKLEEDEEKVHIMELNIPKDCVLKVLKGERKAYMEHESWKHIKNIEEFEFINGKCGDSVNFELQDNGTMIISGSGDMGNDCTFENDNRIKRVVIEYGITSLSENVFKDCRKLRIVEIESSLEEIADRAFSGCENIFSMTIASEIPPIVSEHTLEGLMRTTEIRVPANAIRYYKAAKYWNEFTNYVAID